MNYSMQNTPTFTCNETPNGSIHKSKIQKEFPLYLLCSKWGKHEYY